MSNTKKVLISIASILAVGLGGFVTAFNFSTEFNSAIKKMTSNGSELLYTSDKIYYTNVASEVSNVMSKATDIINGKSESGTKSSCKVVFGKKHKNKLIKSKLDNFSFERESNSKDEKNKENIKFFINDKKFITLNSFSDVSKQRSFIQIPEISESYIGIKQTNTKDILKNFGVNIDDKKQFLMPNNADNNLLFGQCIKNTSLIFDQNFINKIIEIYCESDKDAVKDSKKQSVVKGDIDGVDYKYTKYISEINKDSVDDFLDNFLENIKSDDEISDVFEKNNVLSESKFNTILQQIIDIVKETNVNAEIITWLDSEDRIVGKELKDNENNFSFGYMIVDNKKESGIKVWTNISEQNIIFEGSSKYSDQKLNGQYSIKVNDEENDEYVSKIEIKDYEVIDKGRNLINGEISFSLLQGSDLVKANMNFLTEDKKQTIENNFEYNGEDMMDVSLSYENIDEEEIKLPNEEEVFEFNDKKDMAEYYKTIDVDAVLDISKEVVGENIKLLPTKNIDESAEVVDLKDNEEDDFNHILHTNKFNFENLDVKLGENIINRPYYANDFKDYFKWQDDDMNGIEKLKAKQRCFGKVDSDETDYTYLCCRNNTNQEIPVKDGLVTYIVLESQKNLVPFYINNITFGSSLNDIVKEFGLSDEIKKQYEAVTDNVLCVNISDKESNLNGCTFVLKNNSVYEIKHTYFA